MESRSGKGAFMGSRLHAASTEKGLPTTHFAVGLPRPASHPLDDSPVTLRAQYIAENFTCPLTHHCSIHSAYEAVHRLDFSLAAPECVLGLSHPYFLARARVRQFRKKPSLLHLPSQTIENKLFKSEGFTLIFLHLFLHLFLHPSAWQAMARRSLAQRV